MTSTSFRLPDATVQQIRVLAQRLGMTLTQVVVIAIDRMARDQGK